MKNDDKLIWEMRLRTGPDGLWLGAWGPPPNEPHCEAPPDLVAESPWHDAAVKKPKPTKGKTEVAANCPPPQPDKPATETVDPCKLWWEALDVSPERAVTILQNICLKDGCECSTEEAENINTVAKFNKRLDKECGRWGRSSLLVAVGTCSREHMVRPFGSHAAARFLVILSHLRGEPVTLIAATETCNNPSIIRNAEYLLGTERVSELKRDGLEPLTIRSGVKQCR